MDIAQLGLTIDSSKAVKAAGDLDKFAAAAGRADNAASGLQSVGSSVAGGMARIGAASTIAAGGSRNLTNAVTNASFQIQDFTVQVASGQSALTAFTQQFPQLIGAIGFSGKAGLYGAVLGTAAAIGLTLYSSFVQGVDAAKQFKDAMDSAENSVSAFRTALESSHLPLGRMIEQFGSGSPVIRSALADLAAMERIKAFESIDALAMSMQSLTGYAGQWNAEANRIVQSFLGLTVNSDAARASAFQFNNAIQQLATAQDPVERLKAALDVRDRLDAATGGYKNMNAEQRQMREGLTKIIVHLEAMGVRIDGADGAMDNFRRSAADAQGPVAALVGITGGLADKAWEAARGMAAFAQKQAEAAADAVMAPAGGTTVPSGLGNFGPNPLGQGLAPGTSPRPTARPTLQNDPNWGWTDPGKKGGGGGGKSAAEAAESAFDQLKIRLEKDSQFQFEKYERDQKVLEEALSKKATTQKEYDELQALLKTEYWGSEYEKEVAQRQMEQTALEEALEKKYITQEQYQQRLAELRSQEMSATLGHYDTLFGNMASIAEAGGNRATGIVKAFSIAQGLINSYLAYTQVLADPSLIGRPFLRTALAASTLAAGLAQVANMKSGGGGSSGGSSGATSSATTTQEPQRVTRIELIGPDFLTDIVGSALTQIYDATKNGHVIIGRS